MDELVEVRAATRMAVALAHAGAVVRLQVSPDVPVPPAPGCVLVAFSFPEMVVIEGEHSQAVVSIVLAMPEDLLAAIANEPENGEAARDTASAVYRMALRAWHVALRTVGAPPPPTPDIVQPAWYSPDDW